jgi:aspartate/methionine/tyrosine aminotransferase
MPNVSDWAEAVPMSGVREIFHMIAGRDDILHLEIGQPDFPTPSHIVEAAVESARVGSGYTASAGMPSLREAIQDKLASVNGVEVSTDQIIITQGGVQGCAALLSTVVKPGGEVLIPDPTWPNFEMLVRLHGATPVHYPLDPSASWLPNVRQVESLITDRTELIILNTPANPTGSLFPDAMIDEFIAMAKLHDVPILSDEVYDELIFDGLKPANAFARDDEHVVALYSFSKTYSMTGWRVGYVVAPEWLAPTLSRIQEPLVSCISTVTQAAAEAAIRGPQEVVGMMRDTYQKRRDVAIDILASGGFQIDPPAGGFYLMVPLEEGADSKQAAFNLIDHGVALSPGTAYSKAATNYLRISLASSDYDLTHGMERVVEWLKASNGGLETVSAGSLTT